MPKVLRRVAYNEEGRRVGETHHRAKLTDKQIDFIFELYNEGHGLGYRQIAARFPTEALDPATGKMAPCWHPAWVTIRDVIQGRTRSQVITRWRWIATGDIEDHVD